MHHTLPVRLVQCVGDLDGVFEGLIERQPSLLQTGRQSVALHQLHDEVVNPILFAHVVERADVRVVQAADGFGFALEAFTQTGVAGELFGQDFDGDGAIQARVDGGVHLSHTARTELVGDFVWA